MANGDLEVALAAQQRQALPGMGPHSFQAQFVRYQGSEVNMQGCWTAAQNPGATGKGFAADFVSMEIMDAPAEWAVPVRVDRYIKPPFRVRLSVGCRSACTLPVKVKACVMTELDFQDINVWDPIPTINDSPAVLKLSYTSLKGEVAKSHVIKVNSVAAKDASNCHSMQDAASLRPGHAPRSSTRIAAGANTAGQPSDQDWAAMVEPSSNRQQSLEASDESMDSLAQGRAATLALGPGGKSASQMASMQRQLGGLPQALEQEQQQQVVMEEICFPDLRFAKPSRMHPVYMVFCCTLPFCGDTIITLFTVPTVVTCRAEQSPAALKRLGRPPDLLVQASNIKNGGTTDADRCSGDTKSCGSGSGSKEDVNQGSGGAPMAINGSTGDLRMPTVSQHPPPVYTDAYGGPQPPQPPYPAAAMHPAAAASSPFLAPALGLPSEGPQARPAAAFPGGATQWPGGFGMQAAEGGMQQHMQGLMWPHGSGGSSSTVMLPQPPPPPAAAALARPQGPLDGSSSMHNGTGMQPALGPGGCTVLTNHELSPAGLAAWLEEEYEATGLTRRLTRADVQTLILRSGLTQGSGDLMQQQQLLTHFTAHMRNVFGVLKQISSLWNQTHPIVVVAGFEVGREDAARLLARQPVGTFVCRISLSGTGGLALAVKAAPEHPQAGVDGIVHVLMTAQDLTMRRADTVVRDLPGASHLLDLYSCKRVDKRKIFATNYTHLKKLESLSEPGSSTAGAVTTAQPGHPFKGAQWQQLQPYSHPMGVQMQQAALQQREAAKTAAQVQQESQAEYPLLDMPLLGSLGAQVAEPPASGCNAPLQPASGAAPPLGMSVGMSMATGLPTPEPEASPPVAVHNAALVPPQRMGSALPASAPSLYPSLTLDILDQGACMAMLNGDAKGTGGMAPNPSLDAALLRGPSMLMDLSGPSSISQALEATPSMGPTLAASQAAMPTVSLSAMLPAMPPPGMGATLLGVQDMPPILNKEEQSIVDMLIDG